ncbi:MAG: DUF4381 domain-containing protein [Verrucomicrobiota bacterium]
MTDDPSSLKNLHDVVSPAEVSWWPLAPGWYAVGIFTSLVLIWLCWKSWRNWQGNAYRRAALAALDKASGDVEVVRILRRTALAISPRADVAGKTGDDWTEWIASLLPKVMPDEVRERLSVGLYRSQYDSTESASLRSYASEWIRNHSTALSQNSDSSFPDKSSLC